MKLRNKQTGEIKEWDFGNWYQHIINPDNKKSYECALSEFLDRTAEFREEWEDVPEEPKDFWFVDADGEVRETNYLSNNDKSSLRNFGNYFESKEEAEKAVKRLCAWKRLKDNGMKKYSFRREKGGIDLDFYTLTILAPRDKDSLELLFGGEE